MFKLNIYKFILNYKEFEQMQQVQSLFSSLRIDYLFLRKNLLFYSKGKDTF